MGDYTPFVLGKFTVASFTSQPDKDSGAFTLEQLEISRKQHTASLVDLVGGAEDNLLSIHTVFPFVLFADTLKIDRQKLTVVHNALFGASQTASIKLKDLRNVQTDIGPLFGSIILTSRHFQNNTQTIKFLRRRDISEAQRLLQGFMIAHESHIDTDNIDYTELKALLNRLGQENR